MNNDMFLYTFGVLKLYKIMYFVNEKRCKKLNKKK